MNNRRAKLIGVLCAVIISAFGSAGLTLLLMLLFRSQSSVYVGIGVGVSVSIGTSLGIWITKSMSTENE